MQSSNNNERPKLIRSNKDETTHTLCSADDFGAADADDADAAAADDDDDEEEEEEDDEDENEGDDEEDEGSFGTRYRKKEGAIQSKKQNEKQASNNIDDNLPESLARSKSLFAAVSA